MKKVSSFVFILKVEVNSCTPASHPSGRGFSGLVAFAENLTQNKII